MRDRCGSSPWPVRSSARTKLKTGFVPSRSSAVVCPGHIPGPPSQISNHSSIETEESWTRPVTPAFTSSTPSTLTFSNKHASSSRTSRMNTFACSVRTWRPCRHTAESVRRSCRVTGPWHQILDRVGRSSSSPTPHSWTSGVSWRRLPRKRGGFSPTGSR